MDFIVILYFKKHLDEFVLTLPRDIRFPESVRGTLSVQNIIKNAISSLNKEL
jgi:hypothetical protein